MTDPRRALPSVDRLLREPAIASLLESAPRDLLVRAARESIEAARRLRGGPPEDWSRDVLERLSRMQADSLVRVINATGVVLHTNLGRAPLAPTAVRALTAIAGGYASLEVDLPTGTRGHRADHCRTLLASLTGAEDALVVNNAAGALVLALRALAGTGSVLISRGELIEIGGAFRIPEIIETSGCRLHEVGTTNRTHLEDYRRGLDQGAGAILTVHRSNFEQVGFVHTPMPGDLAALAREYGVPYLYDVGSGLLADLGDLGLTGEPRVPEAVASDADLVLFSGDKLLGGPQAGCIVGRSDAVRRCRSNPFARAVRADKLTLAALEATLRLYRDPARARGEIPVLRMLALTPGDLERRARDLAARLPPALSPRIVNGESAVGGGSFPAARLPTTLVALAPPAGTTAEGLALALRLGKPAVMARIQDGTVVLDPRSIAPEEERELVGAVAEAVESAGA